MSAALLTQEDAVQVVGVVDVMDAVIGAEIDVQFAAAAEQGVDLRLVQTLVALPLARRQGADAFVCIGAALALQEAKILLASFLARYTVTLPEGYLDDLTISVDPDDERSQGPTGTALRSGELQVVQDSETDARHDPWREHIERYAFESSAAVPIAHEGVVYGVLNVYTDRGHAFEGQERDVVRLLGEVVGHAIGAAERKQALMSDDLVELEFRLPDVFGALDLPIEPSGTIALDSTVPLADGEFLVYGTATPDALETVEALVEAVPHWDSMTVRSDGDPVTFELRLIDPPVLSVVTAQGGYVDSAVIEDGDYRMTIHLAPNVEVRRVIDAVETTYSDAELLRHRQITRSDSEARRTQQRLLGNLTDRQQTALEAAYYSGFFEWPRDSSGEDVAESLGITPPTFHQHLREAERKVFDSVLASST